MKIHKVNAIVSKKLGKNFNSWSVSMGASGDLENESYQEALVDLRDELKDLITRSLPGPKTNGKQIIVVRR